MLELIGSILLVLMVMLLVSIDLVPWLIVFSIFLFTIGIVCFIAYLYKK